MEAKQLLDYFSASFLEVDFKEEGITMNALRTVTLAIEQAEEALTAVDLSLEERIYVVTAFRLAVDALSSEHHPLWLRTENTIMHSLEAMLETTENNDSQGLQHRTNTFFSSIQYDSSSTAH